MKKYIRFLLCTCFPFLLIHGIYATDYTWVGGSGNWNDSSKWLPIGVPGPSDNVEISGGSPSLSYTTMVQNLTVLTNGTITGDFDFTVNGLLIYNGFTNGGLYTGNGTFTVQGDFIWLEGVIGNSTATDSIVVNGLLLLSDAAGFGEHYLRKKTLISAGGVNWQGGFIGCSDGAHWVIPPGATLTETCTSYAEIFNPFSGGGVFENQGHFIRNGTAYFSIGSSFDGVLSFINSGTFTSDGAPIEFNGPMHNAPTGIIDGVGSIHLEDDFSNMGTIGPGLLIGELTMISTPGIQNNTLDIEISGSGGPGIGHDRLQITGDFDVSGSTLLVELLGGYSPPFGTSFQIALATDSVKGIFSTLDLPPNYMVTYALNSISVLKNAPPVCAITNPPLNGFLYYDPNIILVEAIATDVNDVVTLVEFYLDGVKFGEDHTAPYSNSSLVNTPMGMYTLTVKATDSFGVSTVSAPVEITVRCIRQDIDNNGTVNTFDYLLFLSSFGNTCSGCPADFNLDGSVNTFDFLSLLAVFGYSCN
jgi:hypothetical protein